jgi:hypothetical protein
MDLQDVTKDLSEQTDYRIEQRLEELMRTNPHYKNLDGENRELILGLIKKYKEKKREGIKTSHLTVRDDMYHLYQNRLKLKLTYNDLDQIRGLLEKFCD